MIEQIQHRKQELITQLQNVTAQIADLETKVAEFRHRQIATQGAIAALDEIIDGAEAYSDPLPHLEKTDVDATEV